VYCTIELIFDVHEQLYHLIVCICVFTITHASCLALYSVVLMLQLSGGPVGRGAKVLDPGAVVLSAGRRLLRPGPLPPGHSRQTTPREGQQADRRVISPDGEQT